MSGAGKTTIARQLTAALRRSGKPTVLVDGDEIRAIFKYDENSNAHTVEGRRINAERIQEICQWLDQQEINVVCSILCIFSDILEANRKLFDQYFEVFIDVPRPILEKRDIKNLYAPALRGETKNVVGVDIPFPIPGQPDLRIDNSREDADLDAIVNSIIRSSFGNNG